MQMGRLSIQVYCFEMNDYSRLRNQRKGGSWEAPSVLRDEVWEATVWSEEMRQTLSLDREKGTLFRRELLQTEVPR